MFINDFNLKDFQHYLDSQFPHKDNSLESTEIAGEGNMNYTHRLKFCSGETAIIKQAPPYCAKFPDIQAPQQRIKFESQFYSLVSQNQSVKTLFPSLLHFDQQQHIMLLEDLGHAKDYAFLYSGGSLSIDEVAQITKALSAINSIKPDSKITNDGMRALNHAHIFDIPLQKNNGLDLNAITPTLDKLAHRLIRDTAYATKVYELGQIYLNTGEHLLHGDYYPASWLKCQSGISIIDPEFCFTGAIEFDLGNFIAHLVLSEQKEPIIKHLLCEYTPAGGYDLELALMFSGTEIMRRLLGYAQLPMQASIEQKNKWLNMSHELVIAPKLTSLYTS